MRWRSSWRFSKSHTVAGNTGRVGVLMVEVGWCRLRLRDLTSMTRRHLTVQTIEIPQFFATCWEIEREGSVRSCQWGPKVTQFSCFMSKRPQFWSRFISYKHLHRSTRRVYRFKASKCLRSPLCWSCFFRCCRCSSCLCNNFCWWCLHWHLGRRVRDLFKEPNRSEGFTKLLPNDMGSPFCVDLNKPWDTMALWNWNTTPCSWRKMLHVGLVDTSVSLQFDPSRRSY